MNIETADQRKADTSRLPLYISGSIAAMALAGYFISPEFQTAVNDTFEVLTSEDRTKITHFVEQLGFWGPLLIIGMMVLQMFLLVVPSPLLMVIAVLAYGPVWGAGLSVLAVGVSATVGYGIGRYLGSVAVARWIGAKKQRVVEGYVNRYGVWAIVITRLAPMLSNDAVSLIGGMVGMNYIRFIGATLLGVAPLAILIAYFGENNDRLKDGLIWTTIVSAVIFAAYVVVDKRKNKHLEDAGA